MSLRTWIAYRADVNTLGDAILTISGIRSILFVGACNELATKAYVRVIKCCFGWFPAVDTQRHAMLLIWLTFGEPTLRHLRDLLRRSALMLPGIRGGRKLCMLLWRARTQVLALTANARQRCGEWMSPASGG